MKKSIKTLAAAFVMLAAFGATTASAIDLKDVLGGGTIGNIVEGIFTKTNLSLEDIVGEWQADGSAVSFKSDNALMKAGGVAAAAALEAKLDPYYEKLGLDKATLTVNQDGTFTLNAGKIKMSGTAESNGDGTFVFNFKALGKVSLGKMTTYVQKSGSHIEIMFDATKLKTLISTVAKVTGVSVAKTAASLLDGYDGLCVGWGMNQVGGSTTGSGLGSVLGNILGGGSQSGSSTTTTTTTTTTEEATPAESTSTSTSTEGSQGSSPIGGLINILKKGSGK